MRLLNCNTLKLEHYLGKVPPYAILSHRWLTTEAEPTYQDIENGIAADKIGFAKIECARLQALQNNIAYLWADTICIDKTNHVEFSEAINSMYRYYADAQVCYAYLADVSIMSDLPKSDWFTRGWTLQELLAPSTVEFYSRSWRHLGSKSSVHVLPFLRKATGILEPSVLNTKFQPNEWTIAERMSWASRRTTTRIEDQAYSLLGIFDVQMPLIYGEGEKAFTRLQQQIMQTSDDHSIFAWNDRRFTRGSFCSLLAPSPMSFASFANLDEEIRSFNLEQLSHHISKEKQIQIQEEVLVQTRNEKLGKTREEQATLMNEKQSHQMRLKILEQMRNDLADEVRNYPWRPSNTQWVEDDPTPWTFTNLGLQIELPLVPMEDYPSIFYALLGYGPVDERPAIIVIRLAKDRFARIFSDVKMSADAYRYRLKKYRYRTEKLVVRTRTPIFRDIFKDSLLIMEHSQLIHSGFTVEYNYQPRALEWRTWDEQVKIRPQNASSSTLSQHVWFNYRHPVHQVTINLHVTIRSKDGNTPSSVKLTSPDSIHGIPLLMQTVFSVGRNASRLVLRSQTMKNDFLFFTACIIDERSSTMVFAHETFIKAPRCTVLVQYQYNSNIHSLWERRAIAATRQLRPYLKLTASLVAFREGLWKRIFSKYPELGDSLLALVVLGIPSVGKISRILENADMSGIQERLDSMVASLSDLVGPEEEWNHDEVKDNGASSIFERTVEWDTDAGDIAYGDYGKETERKSMS